MNPGPAVEESRMAARAARKRPVEYSILYTATLCLLAVRRGDGLLGELGGVAPRGPGDPSYYLKRYLMFGLARAGASCTSPRGTG